jgi:hypothetical protein
MKRRILSLVVFLITYLTTFAQIRSVDCAILEDSLYDIDVNWNMISYNSEWVKATLLTEKWGFRRSTGYPFFAYNTCIKKFVCYTPLPRNPQVPFGEGYENVIVDSISLKNTELIDFIVAKKYIYAYMSYDRFNIKTKTVLDKKLYVVASIDYTEGYMQRSRLNFVKIIDTSSLPLRPLKTYLRKKKIVSKEEIEAMVKQEYPLFNVDGNLTIGEFDMITGPTKEGKWLTRQLDVDYFTEETHNLPDEDYRTGPRFYYYFKDGSIESEWTLTDPKWGKSKKKW